MFQRWKRAGLCSSAFAFCISDSIKFAWSLISWLSYAFFHCFSFFKKHYFWYTAVTKTTLEEILKIHWVYFNFIQFSFSPSRLFLVQKGSLLQKSYFMPLKQGLFGCLRSVGHPSRKKHCTSDENSAEVSSCRSYSEKRFCLPGVSFPLSEFEKNCQPVVIFTWIFLIFCIGFGISISYIFVLYPLTCYLVSRK